MGLAEQERALLQLLYDASLRAQFVSDPRAALARCDLPAEDVDDFLAIDVDGLALDAEERTAILLARFVRSVPLTTSILSACDGELLALSRAVAPAMFRLPTHARLVRVATTLARAAEAGLLQHVQRGALHAQLAQQLHAVVAFELACTTAAEGLRETELHDAIASVEPSTPAQVPDDWTARPLLMAPALVVTQLPVGLAALRAALVPVDASVLLAHLRGHPTSLATLGALGASIDDNAARVVFARAVVAERSAVEVSVVLRTHELPAAFDVLVQALRARLSTEALLQGLARAGAPQLLLNNVRERVRELVGARVLVLDMPRA